jgi:superoxide dismutase, Fe-Mn family
MATHNHGFDTEGRLADVLNLTTIQYPMNRREFLGASATLLMAEVVYSADGPTAVKLDALPYPYADLEPHIDARTMEIHHGKHHQAYVTKLNEALAAAPEFKFASLEALQASLATAPDAVKTAIRNNGGGHYNHTLFWQSLGKAGAAGVGGNPAGALEAAIVKAFGSVEEFKKKFSDAGMKQFGSGWAWLIQKADGSLAITSTPNQDNPLMKGIVADTMLGTPLLGVDVWEHAYYLHYQNKRTDYLTAIWNVVNWNAVAARFKA